MRMIVVVVLLFACNKRDVPLGGACEKTEDCDKASIACLISEGEKKGICTKPCSVPPPGTTVTSAGASCESAGLACQIFDPPHRILGPAYCARPGTGKPVGGGGAAPGSGSATDPATPAPGSGSAADPATPAPGSGSAAVAPPSGAGSGSAVDWQACAADGDCTTVEVGCCDHCNGGKLVAVARPHADAAKAKYKPSKCDVACTERACAGDPEPICKAGRCGYRAHWQKDGAGKPAEIFEALP